MSKYVVSSSPHIANERTVTTIMLEVLIALIPAVVASIYFFGFYALFLEVLSVGAAVGAEALFNLITKKEQTIKDCSAMVTGLLLALNLPVSVPFYVPIIGSAFAIVFVKMLFGGIGKNFANPAATANILMTVLFMKDMTVWRLPMTGEAVTQTTLNGASATYWDLFLGNTAGNIGENSALCILLGALFLWLTRTASPIAPLSCLGSFALLTAIGGYDVPAQLLSGTLMLGACFMTADYTTAPVTRSGKCIFGLGCGVLTFLIRHFGGYPEGILFAVVIMNLLTPYIEKLTRPQPFGAADSPQKQKKRRKKKRAAV